MRRVRSVNWLRASCKSSVGNRITICQSCFGGPYVSVYLKNDWIVVAMVRRDVCVLEWWRNVLQDEIFNWKFETYFFQMVSVYNYISEVTSSLLYFEFFFKLITKKKFDFKLVLVSHFKFNHLLNLICKLFNLIWKRLLLEYETYIYFNRYMIEVSKCSLIYLILYICNIILTVLLNGSILAKREILCLVIRCDYVLICRKNKLSII